MNGNSSSSPLSVALLHNYRERGQMSMKLYADLLGAALPSQNVRVSHVHPPEVLPAGAMRLGLFEKVDSYYGRFVRYPALARRLGGADLYHIVDHAQSYLLSALDPARTVVTCHDLILLLVEAGRVRGDLHARLATRLFRHAIRAMGRAGAIVAVSENTRRDLAELADVDPSRVTVIYPGLNHPFRPMPERRDELRRRLRLPDGPVVLQVGQNTFYKNISGCLRVIARLRGGGLPVTYVRLGKPLRPEHRAEAERLRVTSAILELGPRPADDLAAAYVASDVLLFPSLYEGFGWPPIEAMASGLPVVCSRAGSLGEVVGDAALTSEPEDVEQLADHVAAVLTRPGVAERLRGLGLARATVFDWNRAARSIRTCYDRVLGS